MADKQQGKTETRPLKEFDWKRQEELREQTRQGIAKARVHIDRASESLQRNRGK